LYNHVNQLRTDDGNKLGGHAQASQADSHLPHFQIVDDGIKAIAGGAKAVENTFDAAGKQVQQAMHWFKHDLCDDSPLEMATVGVAVIGTAVVAPALVGAATVVEGTALGVAAAGTLVADMGALGMYRPSTKGNKFEPVAGQPRVP
jgi:hypothetical protein